MEEGKVLLWLETGEGTGNQTQLSVNPINWQGQRAEIRLRLTDGCGYCREAVAPIDKNHPKAVFPCPDVGLWDPEHPRLYRAEISMEEDGRLTARKDASVGFRILEKRDEGIYWNHRALKLRGICYREHTEDWEGSRRDLELFARANVNFIRSIYGPFSSRLLSLCDEMGFLVEDTAPFYEIGQTKAATQDLPHCREDFLAPVRRMLEDGCHVSILIWSLGENCAWGANFREAAACIRSVDPVRPLTFHLPMSVPEEEEPLDIWPVHYIDWKQPFDVCFDQMVIFHTPGAENEIGYMTAQASRVKPVLHEIWSPVACHNRDEIGRDGGIRDFWGESIRRFALKAWKTPGCLGGAVLAGVDEDGGFEGMGQYEWGVLTAAHEPKPEYRHLQEAYAPAAILSAALEEGELAIQVENRFLYTDLSECRLLINGREPAGTALRGEPGSVTEYRIPLEEDGGERISGTAPAYSSRHHVPPQKAGERLLPGKAVHITVEDRAGNRRYGGITLGGKPWEETSVSDERKPTAAGEDIADPLTITWEKGEGVKDGEADSLLVHNRTFAYRFSQAACLLTEAFAGGRKLLAGGPRLNCARLLLGEWIGKGLGAEYAGNCVQVTITGSYQGVMDICFRISLWPDGTMDTSYEILRLYRHMPHTVKAEIGMDPGGLNEKGAAYLLADGMRAFFWDCGEGREETALAGEEAWVSRHGIFGALLQAADGAGVCVCSDGSDSIRLEREPLLTPGAVVDDTDERMRFSGSWLRLADPCGDRNGTETLSKSAGDTVGLTFFGTGIRLYGPLDINSGLCDILLDGQTAAEHISQYPDKVDFPGMSRGYEKRYGQLLWEIHGLPEGEHELLVRVTGKAEPGAQSAYTSVDYAVLEGSRYPEGIWMNVNQDYNYARLVRGCYKRPKVTLTPGVRERFRMKLLPGGN